ncbi:FMN-binding domain protein [Ruminiclostridium papyrosolvens DSM 2782]|uniref:FMN-binding domain protein n=1 Tax=Ruminiclostridium papyrosolvens DSM 2782 TaxID=588581 RepID=F1T9H2_9FIRM|nr:FMN-binding protein [Ruminiclostridium papyrosolvens]EGD49154.1 FMN-binding domain protein [Ruminiclostridium papyrosolvens DSM 2782]WES35633.1 FMN-binding protein [Ruminiclostridium papyrosolvens DSM 2782]
MKKIFALVITLGLILSMAACNKAGTPGPSTTSPSPTVKTPTTSSPSTSTSTSSAQTSPGKSSPSASTATPSKSAQAGSYKDGTYSAKGDAWENGQEEAMVTVKNGKISDVSLKRLTKDGKAEVDYSLFDGKVHNGKQYPNLKEFKETMAKNMVQKQSAQVDTIASATTTTKNWTIAAQRALDKAKK